MINNELAPSSGWNLVCDLTFALSTKIIYNIIIIQMYWFTPNIHLYWPLTPEIQKLSLPNSPKCKRVNLCALLLTHRAAATRVLQLTYYYMQWIEPLLSKYLVLYVETPLMYMCWSLECQIWQKNIADWIILDWII